MRRRDWSDGILPPHGLCRALADADVALLVPLAVYQHVPLLPVDLLEADLEALGDPDTGVEQEQNERVLAASLEPRAVLTVEQQTDLAGAERRLHALLLRGELHAGEDVPPIRIEVAHLLAPGEEGSHLAVAAVAVGSGGAARLEIAEESVSVLDGVVLDRVGEREFVAGAAEGAQRLVVALDGARALALDREGGEVGRDCLVDLGHGPSRPQGESPR